MDYSDFSLHEQRRLAEIERQLSEDRRLVAMLDVLGSQRTKAWRRMRCFGIRLRRPALFSRPRSAKITMIIALCLTVAVPALLVTALMLGLSALSVVAACALPVSPILLALAHSRVNRARGGHGARRES
jgi:VIT1/CCC1 family predicted Fe2+/Mn2+ transporter